MIYIREKFEARSNGIPYTYIQNIYMRARVRSSDSSTSNQNSRYVLSRDTSRPSNYIRSIYQRLKIPGIYASELDIARRAAPELNPPLSASQILAGEYMYIRIYVYIGIANVVPSAACMHLSRIGNSLFASSDYEISALLRGEAVKRHADIRCIHIYDMRQLIEY